MRARFLGKREVARNTWELRFTRPQELHFEAGQYIEIVLLKMRASDAKGNHREFSIVSPPFEKKILRIAFRDTKSAFKKHLLAMKKGEIVEINGPFGQWSLPQGHKPLIFIAGGIGVTPFISMIEEVIASKKKYYITLFMINRDRDSIPYRSELEKLGDITVHHFLGHPTKKDLFTISGIKKSKIYIAGPPNMVRDIVALLKSVGVKKENCICEEFFGYTYG